MQPNGGNDTARAHGRQIVELVSTLTLFTRRTMVAWLPELTEQLGITADRLMVMFELDLQPDISLKDLAAIVLVSPSAMSVMINSLVEQGLVTRVADVTDRRRVVLQLSDRGRQSLRSLDEQLAQRYQQYLATLAEADVRQLTDTTEQMLDVVRRILARS